MPFPFVPQGEDIREGFWKIEQGLFIKPAFYRSGKSLAPGRAAGGIAFVCFIFVPSLTGKTKNPPPLKSGERVFFNNPVGIPD